MTGRPPSPVFLVGARRSGTTMLRLMLDSHRAFAVPFESAFIPEFYYRLEEYGDLAKPENARRLAGDIARSRFVRRGGLLPDLDAVLARPIGGYADLVQSIFAAHAEREGKPRWGDKTPGKTRHMDVLNRLFPTCRFVHLVRDGRDVAASLRTVAWGPGNVPACAHEWRWDVTLGHKMGSMLASRYLLVRFEELVREPEPVLTRICEFLDEPFDPGMLGYVADAERRMPSDSLQWHRTSVRPPDPAKIGVWKRELSDTDCYVFERIAGDALDLLGYERADARPTLTGRLRIFRDTLLGRG